MTDLTTTAPNTGQPGGALAAAARIIDADGFDVGERGAPGYPRPVRRTVALVLVAAAGMYIMMLTLSTALSLRIASIDPSGRRVRSDWRCR